VTLNCHLREFFGSAAALRDHPAAGRHLQERQARGSLPIGRLDQQDPGAGAFLELDEVRALLDAAGNRRTLLATMVLAGLRVGELTALRWRDFDLARGKLSVAESKTDAGRRVVDLSPDLLDELKRHRQDARDDRVRCARVPVQPRDALASREHREPHPGRRDRDR
jgi:integrase